MRLNVNATRMELSRLKNEYKTAVSGHKLLKDKRDEMMRQFLIMKNEAFELRKMLEVELSKVYMHFAFASAALGEKKFKESFVTIKELSTIEAENRNVMNVIIPEYKLKSPKKKIISYPLSDLKSGTETIHNAAESLIKLAELETGIKILSSELEKTRRHVNSLEYVTIPNYEETMYYIRMRIEENTRSNTARLIKVKDIILKEKLSNKK